jgi:hypothetical protein
MPRSNSSPASRLAVGRTGCTSAGRFVREAGRWMYVDGDMLGRGGASEFDAVLFDCDGVLVDSEDLTTGCCARCWPSWAGPVTRGVHAHLPRQGPLVKDEQA